MISIPVQTKAYIFEDEHIKILENIEENLTLAKRLIKVIEGTMHYYSKITRYEQTNLKLYEVAFNLEEYVDKYFSAYEGESWEVFNWFCEDEFMVFEEYLKENDIVMNHIGRTSSFYFGIKSDERAEELLDLLKDNEDGKFSWVDIVERWDFAYILEDIEDNTTANDIIKRQIEEHHILNNFDIQTVLENVDEELESFVELLEEEKQGLNNFQENIMKIKDMYEFLDNYKANQLENFKYFLINQQENYQLL